MERSVIIDGARTPFGKFGGALSSFSAAKLGGFAIKAALERAQVGGEQVDEVIFGSVLQGGQGQIPSRQAARHAGLPWEVATETINKVCASGMRSVTLADQIVRAGDANVIVAGGMESMSNAPYFMPKARWGMRMGDAELKDLMIHDGLTCSFQSVHMGTYGNSVAKEYGITREEQDEWALMSHQRAIAAREKLREEIVAIEVPQRKSDPLIVQDDESPREDTSLEKLAQLRSAFSKDGTITAGNAPGVNDGAAALIVTSESWAKQENLPICAKIIASAQLSIEAEYFPKTPGLVIEKLLKKTGKRKEDIDLFEVNEAFAAVALTAGKLAQLDADKVNINGGAVALGHPIGASGARIILTLMYELKRRGGGLGIASICSGGGQGDAIMIEV
ncbi:acetyl-CoA C-acetyltransferase [Pueribacillus sp. YX66]|uniref:acetyl-CoA C-acetyltransferase n=1 Tax=Pueribacillus sp. YX66 TaxID=3229242 RepID=UPI00358D756C